MTFRGTNLRKEDLNTRANVTIKTVTTTKKIEISKHVKIIPNISHFMKGYRFD